MSKFTNYGETFIHRRNNGSKLWPIIMWQSWLEKNKMDSF